MQASPTESLSTSSSVSSTYKTSDTDDINQVYDINEPTTFLNKDDLEKVTDSQIFPQKRLFTFLHKFSFSFKKMFNKNKPFVPALPESDKERPIYPLLHANIISQIFFLWVLPLISVGYKRTLQPKDLFKMDEKLGVDEVYNRFEKNWNKEINKLKQQQNINGSIDSTGKLKQNEKDNDDDDEQEVELKKFTIIIVLFKTFYKQFLMAVMFIILGNCSSAFNPMLTKKLINFVEKKQLIPDLHVNKGIGYAIGASLIMLLNGIFFNHFFHMSMLMGGQVRSVLTKALLSKSFKLSGKSKHKYTNGVITSMMSTDLSRLELALAFHPFLWGFPFPVVITIVLLIVNLGPIALVGIALFFVVVFVTMFGFKLILKTRALANIHTDRRVTLMREILNSLKMIKYYAWEDAYEKNVNDSRTKEIKKVIVISYTKNFFTALGITLPSLCSLITFLALYKIGWTGRNSGDIFSSLSLFQVLSIQMFFIPMALGTGVDGYIGLQRIQNFLKSSEEQETPEKPECTNTENCLELRNCSFEWESFENDEDAENDNEGNEGNEKAPSKSGKPNSSSKSSPLPSSSSSSSSSPSSASSDLANTDKKPANVLSNQDDTSSLQKLSKSAFSGFTNLNLDIKKGEMVIVTGSIGTGKSSLLMALSGFMKQTSGVVHQSGSLLLCGYPWIQNTTARNNILFGSDFDKKKYNKIVDVCTLGADFDILPAGDMTEIGERGITLSGGQKARINLARTVYKNRDIYLFDDVLSAVDARVGKYIMDYCMMGLLKDKTRILATHQLSLIERADKVVFLGTDNSFDFGTVDDLKERNQDFVKLLDFAKTESDKQREQELKEKLEAGELDLKEQYAQHQTEKEKLADLPLLQSSGTTKSDAALNKEQQVAADNASVAMDVNDYQPQFNEEYDKDLAQLKMQVSRKSSRTLSLSQSQKNEEIVAEENRANMGHTTQKEERAVNSISIRIYKEYVKAGAGKWAAPIFGFYVTLVTFTAFCTLFSSVWLSFWTEQKFKGRSESFYMGLYCFWVFGAFLFLSSQFTMLCVLGLRSSKVLNLKSVHKLLHTPMSFLDTTPIGRVLNRFTKDTDTLDNELTDQVRLFVYQLGNLTGVIVMCIIYLPWFAIAVPFLAFCYICIANHYQCSGREVKRLEAVQRSFVYNNFNEVLGGMTTIKCFQKEQAFLMKNDFLINKQNEATFLSIALQRWVALFLDFVAVMFALIIAILCVTRTFHVSAASAGVMLTYVLQLPGLLNTLLRSMTQMENDMNSVERLVSYATELPQEAAYRVPEMTPPAEWPVKSNIRFEDVSLAYRPELPLVLKHVSISVADGEKIGICGRTGAGKSTIMSALYRLVELSTGKIIIDGVDISKIGLYDLRSKLSIIPQDPVLFKGTVRKNLDPFVEHDDAELWDALVRGGAIEPEEIDFVKTQKVGQVGKKNEEDEEEVHKFHLDQEIEEDGTNYSLGERQLLALSRALVRRSKILILDEATSSVDYETDNKIQHKIVQEFGESTILCIAHRLKTILNYDKILVLDQGEVREFDTPLNLFKQEQSIFREMCNRSGISDADFEIHQL
ncbi:Oligomycin resistance ATP-dependent permease YOR1 [Hanseniaspora osmophila]|uniref:Oligomycin resistance ATP-dependent permease YOR1 n=1 Tax=Hanseniaspora osmophila TaxID=56408 RepID=A0A1E5RHH0_9ASCO|nr:Oligomycin resistance ATP-dependent permease YOR1 [Hanseniaspora osmophila]